jgi:hypothetical protein
MKNLFLTLLCAVLILISCKKEKSYTGDRAIIGQWNWISQYTSSASTVYTPLNTGINETIVFYEDNNWLLVQNNTVVRSGTFATTIETKSTGKTVNTIYYSNNGSNADSVVYYKIQHDSLMFTHDPLVTGSTDARYYIK